MKLSLVLILTLIMMILPFGEVSLLVQAQQPVTDGLPDALIDLRTQEGIQLVKGQWRYSDTTIIEVGFQSVGDDLGPSGPPNKTYDYTPHAGVADFDDSQWEVLETPALEHRRSTGKLCFNWYRTTVTIPKKIGAFDPTGSTVVFEIAIDDYAEVWVNGHIQHVIGQRTGGVVNGFNAPNRVILGRNVKPGQQFQIAVFGINGPISLPPSNFIWVRTATLDFYHPSRFEKERILVGEVIRVNSALDEIVSPSAKMEKLASGFTFIEGPVWIHRKGETPGYLLFSEPNRNRIHRWSPDGHVSVFMAKSGYSGMNIGEYGQPGSNGLTLNRDGLLTMVQHGNRRVIRVEPHGNFHVLADRYDGKRLNSPNDLVYHSSGAVYFTDPPFGLPKFYDDPRKELPYSGVYRAFEGNVQLLSSELIGPNGIAFSPDEKYLYVGNWDPKKKVVMRWEVNPDGTLTDGQVFFDMTDAPGEDALDGVKVDQKGNLFVSGPGGIWILSPEGKHLGLIQGPENGHNMAWGDDDGKTLYITALTGLYRMRMNIPGIRP